MRMRRFVLMVLTVAFTMAALALTTVFVGSSIHMMNEASRASTNHRFFAEIMSALADMGIAIALLIVSFSVLIIVLRRIPIRVTLDEAFPRNKPDGGKLHER